MKQSLKFTPAYSEHLDLAGGQRVRLRLLCPTDKESMRKAFSELSATSRHKRFFAAKQTLSDEELRYFTETDGTNHFALGAVEIDGDDIERDGLGVARCIRLESDPECAEVAITVIDRMQGKGIGRRLLERLIEAATERKISRFRFECLARNQDVQRLVKKVCRVVDTRFDGEIMIAEADLPREGINASQYTGKAFFNLLELLRALAIQSVEMQMKLGRATLNRTLIRSTREVDPLRKTQTPLVTKKQTVKTE